eukprot:1582680-Prymnesium_polylepis.1
MVARGDTRPRTWATRRLGDASDGTGSDEGRLPSRACSAPQHHDALSADKRACSCWHVPRAVLPADAARERHTGG